MPDLKYKGVKNPRPTGDSGGMAHCYMCGNRMTANRFYADRTRSCGLSSRCKACEAAYEANRARDYTGRKRPRPEDKRRVDDYERRRLSGEAAEGKAGGDFADLSKIRRKRKARPPARKRKPAVKAVPPETAAAAELLRRARRSAR